MSYLVDENPRPAWMVVSASFVAILSAIVLPPLIFVSTAELSVLSSIIAWDTTGLLSLVWFPTATILAAFNLCFGIQSARRPSKARAWFLIASSLVALITCPNIWI